MGGGDLNSKKSWHPNTLKNQELVWKAEQKAAQEKKMIAELQRERAQERDRAELNEMAKRSSAAAAAADDRLSWMYDKPDKKVQQEDYLLGKAVDSNFEQQGQSEHDAIPAVSRRVVGSSMLDPGPGDSQVDLVRKMREDPLLLIKERERAARAALLQNPMQRKKLTELLRKEQDKKKIKKDKKSKKKDDDLDDQLAAKLNALSGGKGIDLAALLESGDSSSDSSSDESPKKRKSHKKAKKKKKKKDTSDSDNSSENNDKNSKSKFKYQMNKTDKRKSMLSSDEEATVKRKKREHSVDNARETLSRYNRASDRGHLDGRGRDRSPREAQRYWGKTPHEGARQKDKKPRGRGESPESNRSTKKYRDVDSPKRGSAVRHNSPGRNKQNITERSPKRNRSYSPRSPGRDKQDRTVRSPKRKRNRSPWTPGRDKQDRTDRSLNASSRSPKRIDRSKPSKGLSEAERAARLMEMASAGAAHERERGQRVARQRVASAAEEAAARGPRGAAGGGRGAARALPASLESRIHSNRHNIQRNERHMNENFARR